MANTLSIKFTFSTGKEVIKTVDLEDGTEGDIKQTQFEIYGEGEWFEFEVTHEDAGNFTILDYVIGAMPINLVFNEGSSGA
jgi:hypothetical protein